MARGKKKTTAKPGPVSGPGRLSQRTDMAPTNVPAFASPTGERPYGERKAVEAQAAGAPMEKDPFAQRVDEGVFGATQRPGEPPTAGAPFGPGRTPPMGNPIPDDDDAMIRAMYEVYPHPALLELLRG